MWKPKTWQVVNKFWLKLCATLVEGNTVLKMAMPKEGIRDSIINQDSNKVVHKYKIFIMIMLDKS